jgi:pescadillo protein
LSPFVGANDDGYTPEYAKTLLKLQEEARAIRSGVPRVQVIEGPAPVDEEMDAAKEEKRYRKELEAEMKGVSYSKSLEKGGGSDDDEEDEEEDEESDDDASDDRDESDDDDESDDESDSGEPRSKLTMDMALSEKG